MYVYLATDQRVLDLSGPVCLRHAHCRKRSSRNRKVETKRSREIHDEGSRTSLTHIGHVDRARSDDKEPLALPVQLHPEGAKAIQYHFRLAFVQLGLGHDVL